MKIHLIAGAAVAAFLVPPASAQPPQGGAGGPGGRGMMRMPESRSELQQMVQTRFTEADADHDGFVTREEMEKAMAAGQGDGRSRGPAMRGGSDRFDRLDSNHDGKVSADELSAPLLARFDRADTNHDGTISSEEREAVRAAMRARWQERNGGGDDAPPPPPGGEAQTPG